MLTLKKLDKVLVHKLLGPVWFLYLKTIFCPKKQGIQGDDFVSQFFFFVMEKIKNTENTKFREQEQFSKNTKMMLSFFSKTVLKKNFKKQETNRPLASYVDIL